MGKIASETAELLKEIILSCSAEDILPEELDNFIDFLADVSDSLKLLIKPAQRFSF